MPNIRVVKARRWTLGWKISVIGTVKNTVLFGKYKVYWMKKSWSGLFFMILVEIPTFKKILDEFSNSQNSPVCFSDELECSFQESDKETNFLLILLKFSEEVMVRKVGRIGMNVIPSFITGLLTCCSFDLAFSPQRLFNVVIASR